MSTHRTESDVCENRGTIADHEMMDQNMKELKVRVEGSGTTHWKGNATHLQPHNKDMCRVSNPPGRRTAPIYMLPLQQSGVCCG